MGRPAIGANCSAPSTSSNSARSSSGSLIAIRSPNRERNMFPLTKPASWPNIGRSVTPAASGSSERNTSLAGSAGLAIFDVIITRAYVEKPSHDSSGGRIVKVFPSKTVQIPSQLSEAAATFDLGDDGVEDRVEIPDHRIVRLGDHGSFGIGVDGEHVLRGHHPDPV